MLKNVLVALVLIIGLSHADIADPSRQYHLFPAAYILTIAIEGMILYLLLRQRYATGLIIRNAIIASSATLPFVWFVFPHLGVFYFPSGAEMAAAEVFAMGAEAAVYCYLFQKMGWREAVLVSIACNTISFLIGLAII